MAQDSSLCVTYPDLRTPEAAPQRSGPLTGKVALVTTSSYGLGRAIALELAVRGAKVVVSHHHQLEAEARQLVAAINALNPAAVLPYAISVEADTSSPEGAEHLFRSALEMFRAVDVVVSNVGREHSGEFSVHEEREVHLEVAMLIMTDHISSITSADIDDVFAANFKPHVFVAQQAYHRLSTGGRLIFTSSTNAQVRCPGSQYLYNSSQAAVEALVRSLHGDFGDKLVTVNSIVTGTVVKNNHTERERRQLPAGIEEAAEKSEARLAKLNPLDRVGLPEDVAKVVAFLASDDSAWVNGQTLSVSGGQSVY